MKSVVAALLLSICFPYGGFTQEADYPRCGMNEAIEAFYLDHPELKAEFLQNEKLSNAKLKTLGENETMTPDTVIIPVVFHIIHNNGPENINNDIIYEAVEQLNLDYMANNEDLDDVIDAFVAIIGNPKIQFRLAQYDPDGECTSGITRTVSELTNIGGDEIKALIQWDRASYLNIWVSKVALNTGGSGTILGYATFPTMVNSSLTEGEDGIVMRSDALGIGERALTHEAAHWMDVRHLWGNTEVELESNCNTDDGLSDTPNTIGNYGGCILNATSCGSLDNVQNYMDYAIPCYKMFTEDQADLMIATLDASTAERNQIWTDANLAETGVLLEPILCAAEFEASKVRMCTGTEVDFTNQSYNGDTSWEWTFEGGDPATSDEENPSVSYNTPGLYQVGLTVGNGVNEEGIVKLDYIHVLEDNGLLTPVYEGFEDVSELPNEDWDVFSNNDISFWEISDVAASTGSKSAVLKNYYQDFGAVDILESNAIDLSDLNDVAISFKYAYAKRHDDDDDYLYLKVTKNCGVSWITRETLKANDETLVTAVNHLGYFTPENTEWEEAYVDNISATFLVENFRFLFEVRNGEGNNIYLDDINVFDPTMIGINEVNKAALKYDVYPNPIDNIINIRFNLLHATQILGEVFDISGRKISTLFDRTFPIGTNRLNYNSQSWNAGMYFVKITLEGETFIKKVIKH